MATYNTFKDLASYLGVDPNNPTPESQKIVYDWMRQNPEYEAGPVTNQYMAGYEPPQDVVPQEQSASVPTPTNTTADIERAKGEAHANGNLYYQPEQFKPAEQPIERNTPNFSKFKDTEAFIFDMDGTLVDSMGLWKEIDVEYLSSKDIFNELYIPNNLLYSSFLMLNKFVK